MTSKSCQNLLFVLLLLVPCVAAQEGSAAQSVSAKVDDVFRTMNTTTSPGCALSVMRNGSIVYKRGYGIADLDHDVPVTSETVFHVASISKQFTAASILLLAQEGRLSLDDPVRMYVPELPDFGALVTIRELMHHTSGLRDQWDLLGLDGWRYSLDLITDDDVLSVVARQRELNFPPGTKYLYSNTGYTLLAQIVKRVSGQSFRQFTTARIFAPLGMKNTHFRDDHAEIVKNIAYGYEPSNDTFKLSVTNFDTVGATSLLTTVEDLAKWDENFYDPHVGGAAFLDQMQARGQLNNGEKLNYSSGLVIGTYRGLSTVDHSGSDAGYRAEIIRFPDQHFSVACLCNLSTANPSDLARKVAEIYLAKDMKPAEGPDLLGSVKEAVLSVGQVKSKEGTYLNSDDDRVLRIAVKSGKLTMGFGSEDESDVLKAITEDEFWMAADSVDLIFEPAQPGGKRQVLVKQGSGKPSRFSFVPSFAPSARQLSEYAGPYRSEEIEPRYDLMLDGEKLTLFRPKNKPEVLLPITHDLFAGRNVTIRFVRDRKDKISGFLLNTQRVHNLRFARSHDAL